MINVTVFKDSSEMVYRGFSLVGHADYAKYGRDIVCSAASVLATNAVNSIESFTNDKITVTCESGLLSLRFDDMTISNESKLLVDSLVLGMESIRESYGDTYIKISYKEV